MGGVTLVEFGRLVVGTQANVPLFDSDEFPRALKVRCALQNATRFENDLVKLHIFFQM